MWRYAAFIALLALAVEGHVLESSPVKKWRRPIGRGGARPVTRINIDYNDPDIRDLCPETAEPPPNRVDTSARVAALRGEMAAYSTGLHAYLVPYEDEHMGNPAEYDQRLKYISGFSGSNGFAWVTQGVTDKDDYAALFTDGRYWEQADQQMDCNWLLMKEGFEGYPEAADWVIEVVEDQNNPTVGADPRLVATDTWLAYKEAFEAVDITFLEVDNELIDQIWTDERPARPNTDVYVHPLEYTNEPWNEDSEENKAKIDSIRAEMVAEEKDVLVMHALDETAWLYNIRGSDRDTSPYFYSYAMLFQEESEDTSIRLYLVNHENLLARNNSALATHLNTGQDGTCAGQQGLCVNVREYDEIMTDISALGNDQSVNTIWVDPKANYAIYSAAGDKRYVEMSPVQLTKSIKNPTERRRYKECQIRDSAYVVEFLAELEREIQSGATWTELDASDRVTEIRSKDEVFKMVSFFPISAVGENAAVIHYMPTEDTDTEITTDKVYLLDSGGQYFDGTTDVTRTVHFGEPREVEIEAYTRVLMGVIDLAETVWPDGLRGTDIDARARAPIWEKGWDYNHGTGHGIGYFLGVHEGPGNIRMGYNPDHRPLYDGMFFSDEPGFYEEQEYGIRLESIVEIVIKQGVENFNDKDYLTFEAVTLVPFEPNLIDYDMLTFKHRKWLNNYNAKCREETGRYLLDVLDNQEAYDWLMVRTEPIPEDPNWEGTDDTTDAAVTSAPSCILLFVLGVAGVFHSM